MPPFSRLRISSCVAAHIPLLVVMCGSILVLDCRAEEWTEFRGPTGQGTSTATNLPDTWDSETNIVWRAPVPGKGWSSPIVNRNRVYLTTSVETSESDDYSLRVLCMNAADGEVVWNTEVFAQDGESSPGIHTKNSHASPTPLIHADRLYVHFGHQGTACLDLQGRVLWRYQHTYKPVHGNGGSPIVVGDTLVFSVDGLGTRYVTALDLKTGTERWKTDRSLPAKRDFSFSTPLLIEANQRRQIVSPGSDMVASYDPTTGRELWRVAYDGYSVVPRPVTAHGLVYICTGFGPTQLMAIRHDGEGDVTETHVAWTHKDSNVPRTPSLLVLGNELYMIGDRGIAVCLDARSGELHWKERIGGSFSSSLLFADGKIYLQDEKGTTTVIKPGTTYSEISKNTIPEATLASLAPIDGALFLRSESSLYRIESR